MESSESESAQVFLEKSKRPLRDGGSRRITNLSKPTQVIQIAAVNAESSDSEIEEDAIETVHLVNNSPAKKQCKSVVFTSSKRLGKNIVSKLSVI